MIDTSKIIHAPVGGGRYTVTSPIVKEDYGLYLLIEGLELPTTYEVDFSNSEHNGTSVTMIGNADGVLIPNQFISSGKDVFAFLYHVGADFGRTVYKFRIPNKCRPDRTNEQPTPTQQSVIDQAIAALNDAVEQTAQDVIDADASAQSASADAERAEEARDEARNASTRAAGHEFLAKNYAEQASASATASAQSASQSAQIKADVEDLADDAQASASASAQSATASANSASQASASATSASQSATSAIGYATSAQTSAQTASAKASESAQSASLALTYKTDAESAKTASQTAQGLAESARDSAISAKNDAETARDEAQNLVDGISGKAEQIDQNTADIASLEEDIYKPYAVDSASGAIASFSDGADNILLKSLVVNIDPVQDLHGQDAPYPAGGGKNVFDQTLMRDREAWYNIAVKVKPSTKYIMSTSLTTTSDGLDCYFNNTNAQGGSSVAVVYQGHSVAVTSTKDGYVYVSQRRASGENSFQNYQWQIEEGTTCTDYVPYENICPISGWTGANVEHTGVNVWDEEWEVGGIGSSTGNNELTNDRIRTTGYIEIKPSAEYYCSIPSGAVFAFFYDADKTFISPRINASNRTFTTPSNARYMRFHTYNYGNTYNHDISINYPSTDHDYHPYVGRSIPINWQTEAGTVYGGKLDVLSGELTVYPYYDSYNGETLTGEWISDRDVYASGTTPTIGAQVVNIGAEGTEIQLSPTEVKSLLGQNNIFADTGDTEVVYRADTKLFIERLTAPDSADMIADSNITSGQYFMVGNSLYKATANIASGSAVIVGTNAIRKSLSEALNEINA